MYNTVQSASHYRKINPTPNINMWGLNIEIFYNFCIPLKKIFGPKVKIYLFELHI